VVASGLSRAVGYPGLNADKSTQNHLLASYGSRGTKHPPSPLPQYVSLLLDEVKYQMAIKMNTTRNQTHRVHSSLSKAEFLLLHFGVL